MIQILIRTIKGLVFLIAILAGVAWMSGAFNERISPKETHPTTSTLSPATMEQTAVEFVSNMSYECASGTLESSKRTTISSRILGRIEKILVVAGNRVSAGDTVIELDPSELETQVKQAEQSLKGAQAELGLAKADEARTRTLLEQGVFTRQQNDQALSTLRTATAQVERLAQRLDEAKINLSYTVIKSHVTGRIVDRLAEPGDTASPGIPLLRIYDPSKLRVEAPVRETLAVRLKVGDPIQVQIVALNKKMSGTISEIVPFSESGTRTMLVKIALPVDQRLMGGMFARIAVPAEKRSRLYIPLQAVETIGQLEFVSIINPVGKIERRLVTTGEKDSLGRIEILSGLMKDEKVAWRGAKQNSTSTPKQSNTDNPCQ